MKRTEATEIIIKTIIDKKITYQEIAEAVGRSLIWTTLALHGQATMDETEAAKAVEVLGLGPVFATSLQQFPENRGSIEMPPTDPTAYRFYELIMIYGTTLKAVINEKFGDGIMSAIDFTMDIDRVENPNGDRIKITMEGKFLPYKKW